MHSGPFFYIITISALIGFINIKKFKGTPYVYFIYFVIFTFFIDKLNYLKHVFNFITTEKEYTNNPILNFYIIITFYFFFWFFKKVFHKENNKKIMKFLLLLFTLFIFIDVFYFKINILTGFLARTAVFGSLLLLITLILITKEFLKDQKMINNMERSFLFWLTLGCFLFYIGIIPTLIFSKFSLFSGVFKSVLVTLNVFAHLSFIIGYMISDQKYNY
jgi:hypothetical protein